MSETPILNVPLDDTISDDDRQLGLAVRKARQGRGLSLQQVAEAANISVGQLSQIERGISSPSIRALRAICTVLDMPVHALFNDSEAAVEQEERRIVRINQRRRVDFGTKGMIKEFLNPQSEGVLQLMEIVLQPDGSSGPDPYTHEGEECGVILQGRLELYVDGALYRLAEGDSFYFESTLPHRFRNISDGVTRALWITTPAVW